MYYYCFGNAVETNNMLLFVGIFKDALWVTMTIDVQAMLEFLWILVYCVVLSAIYIAAPTGVPPAAATDCRLAQPATPETVLSHSGRETYNAEEFNYLFS